MEGFDHGSKPVEPTYRMKPYDEQKFQPSVVKKICEEVVASVLEGKQWNNDEETVWTVQISEEVKKRVRALNYPRYKIVVQTVLGQNKNQGIRVASRCLWDTDTDSFANCQWSNDTLWCTCMVFGLYTE